MRNFNMISRIGMAFLAFAIVAGAGLPSRAQNPATVSLDEILREISSYGGGIDSAAFWKLRDYIDARKDTPAARAECETKLLEFLGTKATPVAKMAACRHLRLIGSGRSVPALQAMLLSEGTADMALYALQGIPGTAADKALIEALSKTGGATKTAVIAALGNRSSREAVPVLAPLLKRDGEFSAAAALALSEIGSEAAADALFAGYAGASAERKSTIAASLMKCAEGWLAAKNEGAAALLYDRLLGDTTLPATVREAAMIGKISAAKAEAAVIILDHLKGPDPGMQEAAIIKIKEVFAPEAIGAVCNLLPGLSESARIKLLAVLSGYPRERVLATILPAARSDAAPVRIAALRALESVGDASTVPILVERAAKTRGAEQSAARSALSLLKGRPVDVAMLAMLAQEQPDEVRVELLQAVAERRIYPAKNVVAGSLNSASRKVHLQALRTMRVIGTPSDIPAVLGFLLKTDDDLELAEAETTTASLAQKIADPEGRARAVRARLVGEKNPEGQLVREEDPKARALLYRLLGRFGDDSTLPLLRTALNEPNEEIVDAAARALIAWPTPAARDDVTQLAWKSTNETHRLLAIQGLVRLISLERYRRPEAAVGDLSKLYSLASRPEEQKLILGVLPRFACPEALELAGGLLDEPSVKAEAKAATERIKAQLEKK
jgi:HEAT repeat protein